ncbi:MAG: DUF6268 family outer membrane beta-barrel protein [Bacteroidota bacterium]
MKRLFIIPILLLFVVAGSAQNYVDLAKLYYQNTPQNDFDSINGSTNVQEFGVDLTYPVKLDNGNAVITGLSYNSLSFSLDETQAVTLNDISLKLGMSINHSEKLSGTYMLLPKISSDFNAFGSNDFQIGALALLKIKKSENFKYKIGLFYNTELFGHFFVPFFGFYYISDSKKFEADLSLPIAADVNYSLSSKFKIGFNYATGTKSYNLNKSYDLQKTDASPVASSDDAYIKKYTLEAFPYIRYDITESLLFYAKVGYSVGRAYEVSKNGDENNASILSIGLGDDPTVLNSTFKDGLIYRLGFKYRFHIKKGE